MKRKRKLEKMQLQQEKEQIERLRDEMQQEKSLLAEKRRQERDYLQRMLQENEDNKLKSKDFEELERLEDLKAQTAYGKMLEKQELDRQNEMKKREERAQVFQNRMADTVLKKMEDRAAFEDKMINRYQSEMEKRTNMLMEARNKRYKEDQDKMREFLRKQIEDKRMREKDEKSNIDAQARMWELDKDNWAKEENRLKNQIDSINKDNQDFLLRQMVDKTAAQAKMSTNEFAFNKQLLRQINQKLKTTSQLGASKQDV